LAFAVLVDEAAPAAPDEPAAPADPAPPDEFVSPATFMPSPLELAPLPPTFVAPVEWAAAAG
jgi:hypothetical protein